MPYLQEMLHKLEVGPWIRHLKIGLAVLAVVGLIVGYNWRSFKNFNTQEAMDSAQLARNLAEGRGYTTYLVRPLSMYLLKQRAVERLRGGLPDAGSDPMRVKGNHPDLANPPVYPCLLAAAMKVLPMRWEVNLTKPFWSEAGKFQRYQPDFLIALLNELLFFGVIALTFLLARRLFDPSVAWLSGVLLLGSELLWRFSVSGLSTMLLMLIFLGLVWCVVLVEAEVREPKGPPARLVVLAVASGLMLGVGMLTRYSFGWLIIPVVAYYVLFGGTRKALLSLLTLAVFLLLVTPWIYRNYKLSGTPFGTATYAVLEVPFFTGNQLQRSLQPDLSVALNFYNKNVWLTYFTKLTGNIRQILQAEVPSLGNTWLMVLFMAGLLLGFRNPAIRRLRYFAMMSFGILMVVQALGRTQLADTSPELNSENLIVLLVPLVFVYGVSLFYLMLDQMNLLYNGLRIVIVGAFGFIMLLPMLLSFLPLKPTPVNFPPYHPYALQLVAGTVRQNELMMSDVPWAMAWYGHRQCAWLTLDASDSFFAINDLVKSVSGLYMSPLTMDAPFVTQYVRQSPQGWNQFMLECFLMRRAVPANFPLREVMPGLLPDQLFLTDRKRWNDQGAPITAKD